MGVDGVLFIDLVNMGAAYAYPLCKLHCRYPLFPHHLLYSVSDMIRRRHNWILDRKKEAWAVTPRLYG